MTNIASAAQNGGDPSRRQPWTHWRAELSCAAHPEALPLALSVAAWIVLIAGHERQTGWGLICTARRPLDGWTAALVLLGHQSVMLVAMMLPLVLFQVRHVVTHRDARGQMRGAAAFMAGYLAPWLMVTLALAPLALFVSASAPAVQCCLTLTVFAVAAVWQLTERKTQMLRRCASTAPLRQDGWRADRACLSTARRLPAIAWRTAGRRCSLLHCGRMIFSSWPWSRPLPCPSAMPIALGRGLPRLRSLLRASLRLPWADERSRNDVKPLGSHRGSASGPRNPPPINPNAIGQWACGALA